MMAALMRAYITKHGMATEERNMRIKSKREFERLIRRYDGESGGGSATTTAATTTGAETTAATTQTATTGTTAPPFKAFTSQADYDREIQQAIKSHEAKLTAKLTPAIKAQLEKEANMTAEQRVQAQLDQLGIDRKALETDRNRNKAERLFVAKGISEDSYKDLLDMAVTDDEVVSLERAQKILDTIEKATNEKIKAAMLGVKAPSTTTATTKEADNIGKTLGHVRAETDTAAQKTVDYYKFGGKKQ